VCHIELAQVTVLVQVSIAAAAKVAQVIAQGRGSADVLRAARDVLRAQCLAVCSSSENDEYRQAHAIFSSGLVRRVQS
jgi:hypothetical protein